MRWRRPDREAWFDYWAQAARPLAFVGSVVTLYAVLVAVPRAGLSGWPAGGTGRWDLLANARFFGTGVRLAFELALVVVVLLAARDVFAVVRDRLVPPYDPYEDATDGIDRILADSDVDARRAARNGVRWALYAVLLGLNVLVADVLLALTWSGWPAEVIHAVSSGVLLSVLPDLLVFPLGGASATGAAGSTLTAAVLYVWLPAVPLTVAVVNVHAALYRAIHQGLYEVPGIAADVLARSLETWRSYS